MKVIKKTKGAINGDSFDPLAGYSLTAVCGAVGGYQIIGLRDKQQDSMDVGFVNLPDDSKSIEKYFNLKLKKLIVI